MLMKFLKQKHKLNFKRLAIQCVALLFVIYALADITVLQVYCGNEAVGIPPSHHLAKNRQDAAEKLHQTQAKQNNLHQSNDQDNSQQNCDDDCCFCCSSHVTISYFAVEPRIFEVIPSPKNSISYENKYSNTGLTYLLRPPQTA